MTLINGNRRLVVPKQASSRMDTLGEDTNASESLPGGKDEARGDGGVRGDLQSSP